MPQLYDLMVLIDAGAPDDRRQEIAAEITQMIDDGGTLTEVHDWGIRKITFEIDHRPEADYRLLRFEAEPELLTRLTHNLKIMDGVLRSRIIKQGRNAPPVPPAPDVIRVSIPAEHEGRVAARAAADAPPEASEAPEVSEAPEAEVVEAPEVAAE